MHSMAFFYVRYLLVNCDLLFSTRILMLISNYVGIEIMLLGKIFFLMLGVSLCFNLSAAEIDTSKLELATLKYEDIAVQRRFDAKVEYRS